MKIADLKTDVLRISDIYAREHGIDRDRDWALLKLQEELGELTKEHLNLTGRARGAPTRPPSATKRRTFWGCCSSTATTPASIWKPPCSANG